MKRTLHLIGLLCIVCVSSQAQEKIFPLKNARADNDVDMNGKRLLNLDTSNLILGAGVFQPLDSDLTSIAGLTTASYGLGVLQLTNAVQAKTYFSVILPIDLPPSTNKFLTSYNGTTGAFTNAQPMFSNLSGVNDIPHGGTGQITAAAALAALLPAQAGHGGQSIITDGTTASWSGSPVAGTGVSNSLAMLTTKPISNASDPTNGQVLTFVTSTNSWEPKNVASAASGTVTTFSAGDATNLFTTSVTNATSIPALSFIVTDAPSHSVWGNLDGVAGPPGYIEMKIDSLSDAGTLSQWALRSSPIGNIVGDVDTQVLSGKTIDSADNIIRTKQYIRFDHPNRVDGSGAVWLQQNSADYNNQAKFNNSLAASGNWAEYRTTLPDDFDNLTVPRIRLKFRNWSTNTGAMRYIFSMASVGNSAPSNQVMQNPITVDFAGDAAGADADIESVGWVSLTGWATSLIPGQYFIIRVARDGSNAADTSTADTVTMVLEFEYESVQ